MLHGLDAGQIALIVLAVAAGAALVAKIAYDRGRDPGLWFVYGAALFPVALLHALLSAPDAPEMERRALAAGTGRKCPACAELVKPDAALCRYCGTALPPVEPAPAAASAPDVVL